MNIHEYQTKILLKKFGIPVPDQVVISKIEELDQALDTLGTEDVVLKVQVHAGGRGKAGGVKLAHGKKEALEALKSLIGLKIVNRQTGPEGIVAKQILASPISSIEKEFYLAAIMDRKEASGMLIASTEGGMEIEEVAKTAPEKIIKLKIPKGRTFKRYELYPLVKQLGWTKKIASQGIGLVQNLAKAFQALDASLLEINPLVLTKEGQLVALDAKLSVDDNALFRQPEIQKFYDPSQLSEREQEAKEADLAYVGLDGNIGCMVNGAGLAMATMDIIDAYGGKPANFLDVGGSADKEKIAKGFKIILSDSHVKTILVNIFGGIMNCETLAEGIIAASKELGVNVPLVVRMEGNHKTEGMGKLKASGLKLTVADNLADAAKKAVEYGHMGG
ncbi:MAG: ADP-forming succinate--CoA ligase subunit beta [Chlamydiia bacterium]|nr:ADP-forming succinate--CoA ligase subunit beta [Chlamydiia bacterium]